MKKHPVEGSEKNLKSCVYKVWERKRPHRYSGNESPYPEVTFTDYEWECFIRACLMQCVPHGAFPCLVPLDEHGNKRTYEGVYHG